MVGSISSLSSHLAFFYFSSLYPNEFFIASKGLA